MQGLLADVNVQGCVPILFKLYEALDLAAVLAALELRLATFADLRLQPDLDDRALWNICQADGWVLFTENRNEEGRDSFQATLGRPGGCRSSPWPTRIAFTTTAPIVMGRVKPAT